MPGLHVQLDVSYYDDAKIIEAGEKAEVLFIRSLCLAKRILSDGFVADSQLPRFCLPNVKQRADKLVEVGLWTRDDVRGGYQITSWLKRNKTAAEIAKLSEKRSDAGSRGGRPKKQPEKQIALDGESKPETHREREREREEKTKTTPPPTPSGGGGESSKLEGLRDYLVAESFDAADVDVVLKRFESRQRFGEPIKDPVRWAEVLLAKMADGRVTSDGRASESTVLLDGEPHRLDEKGYWVPVSEVTV